MSKNELTAYDLSPEQIELIKDSQKVLLEDPVDIVSLAKDFGVKKVLRATMDREVSGQIEKRNDGYYIITNEAEPKWRRRFTIAHELAHFILHKDQIGDGVAENTLYRSGLSSEYEVEANRLAADILMPLDKIEEYISNEGTDRATIGGLAKAFFVSYSAIRVRLGIPWDRL